MIYKLVLTDKTGLEMKTWNIYSSEVLIPEMVTRIGERVAYVIASYHAKIDRESIKP